MESNYSGLIILATMAVASILLVYFAIKRTQNNEAFFRKLGLIFLKICISVGLSIFILYLWGILHGDPHPFDQGALLVLAIIIWPVILILSIIIYNFLGEIKFFKPNGN